MNRTDEASVWRCAACGETLRMVKVGFSYMKGNFEIELPACAGCGQVLVPEELAAGRMADAERILEDK